MKLQPMKMRTFLLLAVLCVAAALLAEHYPGFQVLEYAKWGLVAWLALDTGAAVLAHFRLVRAGARARRQAREDAQWDRDAVARLTSEPYAADAYPLHAIRTLDELPPIPELHPPTLDLPDPPELDPNLRGPGSPDLADAFEAGMLPPMNIRREFAARRAEHDRRMAEGRMTYDERKRIDQLRALEVEDYVTKVLAYDDAVDAWLAGDRTRPQPIRPERPSWLRSTRVLPATTLPTGSESTQEARSGAVSGDSQLLDKDRDAWGNEVHGAVKGLVESDGVALTPHEEADLRERVHAFMAPGEPSTLVGDPPGIEGSKDEKPLMYADLVSLRDAMDAAGIVPLRVPDTGTAADLIREVEAKHGMKPAAGEPRRFIDTLPGVSVGIDTVLPPIEYGKEALADLRNHGVAYHRVALDDAGNPRFEHVPASEVLVDRTITEASMSWKPVELRPENVGRYFGTPAAEFGLIAVDPMPVMVMGPERMEAHAGPLHWQEDELERALGSGGMVLTSPPAGPARDADGLHPTNLRLRQQERQRRYWVDRITQLDPDLMDENNHSGPAEVVRALFRSPDGMGEEDVRRTVTQLAHEVAAYVPPRLAGPSASGEALAQSGELAVLADTRIHAHGKVEAIGKVAIALAQANARLRTQAVAHFGQRLAMDTRGTEHSDVEVDDNPGARFAAMSRDEALAICEAMGWVRPALGVGYTWVMD